MSDAICSRGAGSSCAIDCVVLCTFGFIMAYVWFKISNLITPIRVSAETEMAGLDMPEMGALGYPDFQLVKETGTRPRSKQKPRSSRLFTTDEALPAPTRS